MANRWGNSGNSGWLYFWGGSKITADGDCSHEVKSHLLLGKKVMTNLESILQSILHYFANKGPSSQSYGFFSGHVWMWELDASFLIESWALKNWCFWTVEFEKTLENIHWKDWCWSWNSNALATWCEELIHWKRPWYWERLRAGEEGGNRLWDDW